MHSCFGLVTSGQLLDGRFLLGEQIGRGGMSTVFRADDLHNGNRPVVLKVPPLKVMPPAAAPRLPLFDTDKVPAEIMVPPL